MRVAIFADIHGNLPALEAVLAEIDHEQPDHVICLGDVAAFGPQPREVVALLRERDYPTAMGNADEWLLHPQPTQAQDEGGRKIEAIDRWAADQLAPADLDYLRTFQPTLTLDLGGATLLAFHGSPRSNTEIIVATTPDDELATMFKGFNATVMCGGHTHAQLVRRYATTLILNPGSVGLPYEQVSDRTVRNPPWAEYALVTWKDGRLSIDLRRVRYDVAPVVQAALASGMPYMEWWTEGWQE